MSTVKNPPCTYCSSTKVTKHGKTSTGNPRFRCRSCGKTWVLEKNEPDRPDIAEIAEEYLNGKTCRDLVSVYHSSPLRINQKIREFLSGCPNWENYLDASTSSHEPRLIYLIGRTFSCSKQGSTDNTMFLAVALDGLSSVVLGYQIGKANTSGVWFSLLDRLSNRGFICNSFMANGSKIIEEAVSAIFPYATLRINYHRAYRDKEIQCCLSRLPINNKLFNDAIKIYKSFKNHNLLNIFENSDIKFFQDMLFSSQEEFIKKVKDRFENKDYIRLEGFTKAFQSRFEKFHMLKDDPYPLINGWIAKFMLVPLNEGYNKLSLYRQIPCKTNFANFTGGTLPQEMELTSDSTILKSFVIETAARGLQLPVIFSRCEMKFDKCSLF